MVLLRIIWATLRFLKATHILCCCKDCTNASNFGFLVLWGVGSYVVKLLCVLCCVFWTQCTDDGCNGFVIIGMLWLALVGLFAVKSWIGLRHVEQLEDECPV